MLLIYCFSDSGFDSDIDSLLNGSSISLSSDVNQKLEVHNNMNFVYSLIACFDCQLLASGFNEYTSFSNLFFYLLGQS